MTIDSHHHFWKYNEGEYPWMGDALAALRRDFLPPDLEAEAAAAGVTGVISVQARQMVEETRWLLELAAACPLVRGVVGWVPLVDPAVGGVLGEFAASFPALRGVRHVLHDEADDAYMLRDDFNRGLREVTGLDLAYDILIFARHLPNTLRFVDQHPDQRFIVDHIAKPEIRGGEIDRWSAGIRELARRPNIWCKVSGMATEADFFAWTPAQLQPYFEVVLDAFGPGRLLFGSDWPVCGVAVSYGRWVELVRSWIAPLSPDEQAAILGGNAIAAYRLADPPPVG
jgi:L-fuconolactonase